MNWLGQQASRNPARHALTDGSRRWSYAELMDEAQALADYAHKTLGIHQDDIVCLLLPQCTEYVLWFHALMLLDAIAMPVSMRYSSAEIQSLLTAVRPDGVVYDAVCEPAIRSRVGSVLSLPTGSVETHAGFFFRSGRDRERQRAFSLPDETAAILASSGSTGMPKLIPITRGNLEASARASAMNLGVLADDNWLGVIPLHHVGGLSIVTRAVIDGAAVTLVPTFDPARVLASLRAEHVTIALLVPTMLKRLMEHERAFTGEMYPSLRAILLGGSAADEALLTEAWIRALPVLTTYGLTEGCSQVATMHPSEKRTTPGCAGRPLHGVSVSIRNDRGEFSPENETGEIWIRGDLVIQGYMFPQELNRTCFRDGWFRTGDIGRLDANGMLWITGRLDNLIVTGGENVYPEEVEAVLSAHAVVEDAAVVGIPDDTWGQRLMACIVLRAIGRTDTSAFAHDGVVNDSSELIASLEIHCRGALAGFKIPRQWIFLNELPRNATGKVLRTDLARKIANRDTAT